MLHKWPHIREIRAYPHSIKRRYKGVLERNGSKVYTQTNDLVMMNILTLNPMRGTGTKGGWIWVIISLEGTVNSFMGGLIIYSTKVSKATSCVQRRAQVRLLRLEGELRRG